MSANKIDKKITGFKVVSAEEKAQQAEQAAEQAKQSLERVHEDLARPEFLMGSTYKIKTPMSEHALYITINDIVLNQGTEHEQRHPYEMFINSKNMEQFQWIVALTRVISAVFRKGGDINFMVEELKAVFDPKGGYFKKGGKFMPSLVAEIGEAIEQHLKHIGLIESDELDEHQKALIASKRAEYEAKKTEAAAAAASDAVNDASAGASSSAEFPPDAQLCGKCNVKAAILMDGCYTCLNCGDSKCG
ncbi:NrdJb [Motiliproteus coralliicola]|uniref:ribonucleoside-diphosphate reductase n=1 Tax=Motiliproteus coralliicola TaxID=2283196 RepID=A0A369WLN1_9GAMM|nr:NrdJb [Motiliproteus coralliicola]RDE22622.1 NrdJb [Motiliproteus coralliicola]